MYKRQDLLNEIIKEKNTIEHNKALMEQMRDDLEVMTYEYEDMQLDLTALQNEKIAAMNEAISTKEGYQAMLDAEEAASEQAAALIKEYLATTGDEGLSYGCLLYTSSRGSIGVLQHYHIQTIELATAGTMFF